ncbi:hypothetical protein QP157_16340 [Sphingomonas sp. LR61]
MKGTTGSNVRLTAPWSMGPLPDPTSRASAPRSAAVSQGFATPTASSQSPCRAASVAMALDSEHPVPCVLAVATRGAVNRRADPDGDTSTSSEVGPSSCPPFASTSTSHVDATSRAASSDDNDDSDAGAAPAAAPAPASSANTCNSARFGVSRSASPNSAPIAAAASSSSNRSPLVATITGSTTTTGGRCSCNQSVTTRTTGAVPSIPIFTASIVTSSDTASSCSRRNAMSGTCTDRTPCVFCATRAVTTPMPYPSCAAIALRSACSPAPPVGSVPAMARTRGTLTTRPRPGGPDHPDRVPSSPPRGRV